jgi:hypothetical protein
MKKIYIQVLGKLGVIVVASMLLGSLEYQYIQVDGYPYRLIRYPVMGPYCLYHMFGIIPLIALFAFYPLIIDLLTTNRFHQGLRRTFFLDLGAFLSGLVFEDVFWFASRALAPLESDPLAFQWVQPSDFSAVFLGHANIFGLILPLWYLILLPPIIAIFSALLMTPSK